MRHSIQIGKNRSKIRRISKRNSFINFEKQYLQPQTEPIILQSDWAKYKNWNFDAVIVGSDQIWRDDYAFNSFGYNLFLDFIHDQTLRIAYAPSLGKESWNAPAEVEQKVKVLLQKFDAISVREDTSIDILKSKFGVDSTLVIDPTMLLTADEYRQKLGITNISKKPYIAAYILDYDTAEKNVLAKISKALNQPVRRIAVKKSKNKIQTFYQRFMPMKKVTEWVRNIAYANYVITNSFHGMVFSVIFRKQFLVFMNSERGAARFKSFLKMFGLEGRLVDIDDEKYLERIHQDINYSGEVELKIEEWINWSKEYLHKSLKGK